MILDEIKDLASFLCTYKEEFAHIEKSETDQDIRYVYFDYDHLVTLIAEALHDKLQ